MSIVHAGLTAFSLAFNVLGLGGGRGEGGGGGDCSLGLFREETVHMGTVFLSFDFAIFQAKYPPFTSNNLSIYVNKISQNFKKMVRNK